MQNRRQIALAHKHRRKHREAERRHKRSLKLASQQLNMSSSVFEGMFRISRFAKLANALMNHQRDAEACSLALRGLHWERRL